MVRRSVRAPGLPVCRHVQVKLASHLSSSTYNPFRINNRVSCVNAAPVHMRQWESYVDTLHRRRNPASQNRDAGYPFCG